MVERVRNCSLEEEDLLFSCGGGEASVGGGIGGVDGGCGVVVIVGMLFVCCLFLFHVVVVFGFQLAEWCVNLACNDKADNVTQHHQRSRTYERSSNRQLQLPQQRQLVQRRNNHRQANDGAE